MSRAPAHLRAAHLRATRLRVARGGGVLAAAFVVAPGPLCGQIGREVPPPGAASHRATITERYRATGLKRWFLGGGYRDVWETPIDIPVLDLDTTAGGLTPVETGGYGQTVSLEFMGGDGLEYAVRSIDKDPTRRLDSLYLGTIVATIVQDQVGQFLPTAGLVVDPLMEATGILHPRHRLVVVPDDVRLGRYREDFAGVIGMFVDRPQEGSSDTRGFAGSTRIINTERFLDQLEQGGCDRADVREYLKARLVDVVIGDRDRHPGQWRWARFPEDDECDEWRPIPEDRDQAFIRNDGAMLGLYRMVRPQQVPFGHEYPSLVGLTFNAWELDRQLLTELDEDEWRDVAEEIVAELTDDVVEDAVRRLPAPHYALQGAFLERALKARRDGLVEQTMAYYRLLGRESEIVATDRDEIARIEHLPDGRLRVAISFREPPYDAVPYFSRTFSPDVTREVRIFLHGGDDVVELDGGRGHIEVRAIGGGGDDRFVNRSATPAGDARFYDDRGDNAVEGEVRFDERPYERPAASNLAHRYALDWGGMRQTLPQLSYDSDVGIYAGVQVTLTRYGFRRAPWRSRNRLSVGVAGGGEPFVRWDGRFRDVILRSDVVIEAGYSGLDVLRFYGYGNTTGAPGPHEFFRVEQQQIVASPGLEWTLGPVWRGEEERSEIEAVFRPTLRIGLAPVAKYTITPLDDTRDRFIGTLDPAPLGLGRFGQLGARSWIDLDTRDGEAYPTSGLHVRADGALYAPVWDAPETFGTVAASVATYLTPGSSRRMPTLAARASGERVFGDFPFHEAAYLGGKDDLRGFREERWAGDASLLVNTELRLPVAEFDLLFPTEIGVHGVADVGRVYHDGGATDGDSWHRDYGGGLWLTLVNRAHSISLSVVNGDYTGLHLRGGLLF